MEDLVRISTYAKEQNISVTWVYKLEKNEEIEIVKIDGVKFVKKKK
tara:strand:- start:473 stop:610 length:138 start_codon:yes stop_codon:yes gene_type:complete